MKGGLLWYQNTKLCQKPPAPATHRKLLSFPRGLIDLRFARNSFAWDCPGSFSLICWIHSHEGCIHPKQSLFLSNRPHTSLSSAEPRDYFENFALNAHERQLQNSMICTKEENVTTTLRQFIAWGFIFSKTLVHLLEKEVLNSNRKWTSYQNSHFWP